MKRLNSNFAPVTLEQIVPDRIRQVVFLTLDPQLQPGFVQDVNFTRGHYTLDLSAFLHELQKRDIVLLGSGTLASTGFVYGTDVDAFKAEITGMNKTVEYYLHENHYFYPGQYIYQVGWDEKEKQWCFTPVASLRGPDR